MKFLSERIPPSYVIIEAGTWVFFFSAQKPKLTVSSLVFTQRQTEQQQECVLCVLREDCMGTPRLLQHTVQTSNMLYTCYQKILEVLEILDNNNTMKTGCVGSSCLLNKGGSFWNACIRLILCIGVKFGIETQGQWSLINNCQIPDISTPGPLILAALFVHTGWNRAGRMLLNCLILESIMK